MFICCLFSVYLYVLAFLFTTTIVLIFLDRSWGPIPHWYLKLLERIHEKFQEAYPDGYFERLPWKDIINEKKSILQCNDHHPKDFEMVEWHTEFPYATSVNLTRSGIEAIIQDDFTGALDFSPEYQRYKLNSTLWRFLSGQYHLKIAFVLLLLLRFIFIFPLRILLYSSSFVFLSICCVLTYFVEFTDEKKVWISKRYCRIYTAGIGLVAHFYGEENRPKPPGVCVSNHFSANDIMVICSDIGKRQKFLYTVTGQQHAGIIGFVQNLVGKLCSAMWLERSIADSRLKFLKDVLTVARHNHLVLMFPEGYCSNGTKVLQFRKAVFEKNITIYPIAIRQDSRFGDAYWQEEFFAKYLVRLLYNFATIYHVTYLPPMEKMEDELSEEFAARVQNIIAKVANAQPMFFQGTLYYKTTDREKYKTHLKKLCSTEVHRLASEAAGNSVYYQLSASDGPS